MDLLIVLIVTTVLAIPKLTPQDKVVSDTISINAVAEYDVPIGDNLQNITEPDAFMLIIRRLGLS